MRPSSNNHKVPTVLLGQGETRLPTDNSPFGMGDWPAFPPANHPAANGQAVNRPQNSSVPLAPNPRPMRSPEGSTDMVIDYWREDLSQDDPAMPQGNSFGHTSDDLFFDEDVSLGNRYEFSDSETSALEMNEVETDDFDSDDFDDEAPADIEESLDYLFEDASQGRQDLSDQTLSAHGAAKVHSNAVTRTVKQRIEQSLLKAVSVTSSGKYLRLLSQILGQAILTYRGSANKAFPAVSARSPAGLLAPQNDPHNSQLSTLQLLTKRYAARGFAEQAVLEDAVEIYEQTPGSDLCLVVKGLVVRVVLKPRLDQCQINPALLQRLYSAAGESIKLLVARRQLKALPGIAARLGQLPIQDCHALNQLPQQLHRAATRVTQNRQLYERLCDDSSQESFLPETRLHQRPCEERSVPIADSDSAQRLRIDGPVEIFIRPLDD